MFRISNKALLSFVIISSIVGGIVGYYTSPEKSIVTEIFGTGLGIIVSLSACMILLVTIPLLKKTLSRFCVLSLSLAIELSYIFIVVTACYYSVYYIFSKIFSFFKMEYFYRTLPTTLFFAFLISVFITLLYTLSFFTGAKNIFRLILGKYSSPKEKNLVVMFADLKSSTTVAEKLGTKLFMGLINNFISDITESIEKNNGEIYKYLGDGIICLWYIKEKDHGAWAINAYDDMGRRLEMRKKFYMKKFSMVPEFTAGIHYGKVIIGEVGTFRKELCYLGDTLNATARIQSLCKEENTNILFSQEFADVLPGYVKKRLIGERILRGKENTIKIYTI